MRTWTWVQIFVVAWLAGCEDHSLDWCVVPVEQEAVDLLGIDPGYIGATVCTGGIDNATCKEAGGDPEFISSRSSGFEHYCPLNGYPVDCGDVFLPDGESCVGATTAVD